ncbi:uncharacterized protein [Nicotiana tomentosiformis]|uniref:uncharacterized protein n=1 Tax=Nicotiana tomentosiformis TaxID=4098 RepID=UPI00388C8230
MDDKFIMAHVGAKKAETRVNDIFAIKQSPGEGLRDFLTRFNRQGHLKELFTDKGRNTLATGRECPGPPKPPSPAHTINMIIGGSDNASIKDIKFTATHKLKRSITHERYDGLEESITFDESDADGLTFPYNDVFVITLKILDTNVKRIMIDGRSGACIIHNRVLTQMRHEDKIVPCCITLTGFNNVVERTSGEITLLVLAGGVSLEMIFHIMDQDTAYNAIVRQPWIYPMRAALSSLYQVIKFPIPWGIFSIWGEQRTSRECYRIVMDITTTQQNKEKEKEA